MAVRKKGTKERICKWCGKPILPPYTNNRQSTHEGTCRIKYHAWLKKQYMKENPSKNIVDPTTALQRKIESNARMLEKAGIPVHPGTKIVDRRQAKDLIVMANRRARHDRTILIQKYLFWNMYVDRIGARDIVGNEAGSRLLNFHEYPSARGRRGVKWYNTGQSAYCIVYRENGDLFFRYDRDPNTMTFWPNSEAVTIKNEGSDPKIFGTFDLVSFRKYLERIRPWVMEGLHEAWCKEAVEKHCPPPWVTKMLQSAKTPRLSELNECAGKYADFCLKNTKTYHCHPVIDLNAPCPGPSYPYRVLHYVPNSWSEPILFKGIQRPDPLPADVTNDEIHTARRKLNARIQRNSRILKDKPRGLFENV